MGSSSIGLTPAFLRSRAPPNNGVSEPGAGVIGSLRQVPRMDRTVLIMAFALTALSPGQGRASPGADPSRQLGTKGDSVNGIRRQYLDTEGTPFPAPLLDARSGVAGRQGFWRLAQPGERVEHLAKGVFAAVQAKAMDGEREMLAGNHRAAHQNLLAAFALLPEPRQRWNAAGWILATLGENSVRAGDFRAAEAPLQDSVLCPGGPGNPWVHLRLGQVRYELGQSERAADELARAYMGGGREVFSGQDPKYFALVERLLRQPPGADRLP